ncbi:MAG: CotH kinase family protein [Clostridia bacterium]|nr:CotH kinase family protein [Clostridia bacterium]
MQKLRFLSLLLAAVLLFPTLTACGSGSDADPTSDADGDASPDQTSQIVSSSPYDEPDTEITDSPDGSTRVIYALSIENSGEISGETEQTVRGDGTSEVTATSWVGYEFVRWSDGSTSSTRSGDKGEAGKITTIYAIMQPVYLEMPVMHITTETGYDVESKQEYILGTLTITNCAEEYAMDERIIEIRGRGNKSWEFDKKSYHIQLDSKANLLGIGSAKGKHWNLLANHCDQSLLRNHTALRFASMMSGIAYSPACTSVEVYINGVYNGVYLLTESIRVGDGRVDIAEDPEAGTDIGYLVQLSNYAEEYPFHMGGKTYEIKSDLSEDPGLCWEQQMYIQDYMSLCYEAVLAGNREEIERLMDISSIIDTYIVEETVKNLDVGWDSFYFYKDAGGKLAMGPIWDFDLSLGNANEGCENYTDLHAAQGGKGQSNPWFYNLMAYKWFRELVAERFASQEVQTVLNSLPELIRTEAETYYNSFCRNFDEWQIFSQQLNREPREIMKLDSYKEHYEYLIEWLENRLVWLRGFIGGDRYHEGYNTESGGGIVTPPTPDPDPSYKFECSGGSGKYSDPYLISTAEDFMSFTEAMYNGENFYGKYFRQTADLDMTSVRGYRGIGSAGNFAGIYDGDGYTIHAELSGRDECIFPYLSGLVINLGTTGSVNNSAQAAGICRSIRQGGGIVNCYSLMDVTSHEDGLAGGLSASTQSGDILLVNCYFAGTVVGSQSSPSNVWQPGRDGTFAFLYSPDDLGGVNVSETADVLLPRDQMNGDLADLLNANLSTLSELQGSHTASEKISVNTLCTWAAGANGTPVLNHK